MKRILGPALLVVALSTQAQVLNQRPKGDTPDYTLGAGDELAIHVADLDNMPTGPVRIGPSGMLDFPLVGEVQAVGLTVDQFRHELSMKLSKYISSPDITINLVDTESRPVSVVGEVSTPGLHQMVGPKRLLDVLSMSGGLKPDAGPNVVVTRQAQWGKLDVGPVTSDTKTGTTSTRLPLDSLLDLKAPEDNIMMQPGDVVSVPRAELVYVVGDVRKAGGFEMTTHNTMSVLHVVTLAEGLAPNNNAGHAHIIRPPANGDGPMTEIPVDIDAIFKGKSPDVPLYANDVLFVPHSGFKAGGKRAIEAAIGLTTGILIYR